jgi:hypothetical protein
MTFEEAEAFGYTLLQRPMEALNIIYPHPDLDDGVEIDPKYLVGSGGLDRIMKYKETSDPPLRYDYVYNSERYGRIFSPSEIGKYSGKIKSICDTILKSSGVILIFSKYIDGGIVPMALALEEMGFSRANKRSLLDRPPVEPIDSISMKPRKNTAGVFNPAKYVMISGDKGLSSDNISDIKDATNPSNKDGTDVKVILISVAGSEGIDLSFIRQVHIMDPWYNMNRIEQILGRAIRTCSHKLLPYAYRNVELYLYGTQLSDRDIEAIDLYIYRVAERKAIQAGRITRLLKKCAVDCILNIEQVGFNVDDMDIVVDQRLSNGKQIKYRVGDRPFSSACDYMAKCDYKCKPDAILDEFEVSLDTYDESFANMNVDKLLQRIRALFKDKFFYRTVQLIRSINITRQYSSIEISTALTRLIEDKTEILTDGYGRMGRLVNIGDLYVFKPLELIDNDSMSLHDISTPIDHKNEKIKVKLPKDVKEMDIISSTNKELLDRLTAYYTTTFSEQDVARGETDWYVFCSKVMIIIMDTLKVSEDVARDIVVHSIIDTLEFNNMMVLLNTTTKWSGDFMSRVKRYIDSITIYDKKKKISGIMLQNNGNYTLVVKRDSDDQWRVAEYSDNDDLSVEIGKLSSRYFPILKKMNNIIGLITSINSTSDNRVFKIQYNDNPRHKGSRCDQSSKKDILDVLHTIGPLFDTITGDLNKIELCILQEMLFRLYDLSKKGGKVWYTNPGIYSFITVNK